MIKKLLAVALAVGSMGAHAALTTLAPWQAIVAPAAGSSLNGVVFNTAGTVTSANDRTNQYVAIGAHPYTNGVTMPNDGVSIFYSTPGQINPTHANWNFDFAFNVGTNCTGCTVFLDIVSGALSTSFQLGYADDYVLPDGGFGNSESILFGAGVGLPGFNPNANSVTNFTIRMMDAGGTQLLSSAITVEVPEPTSLALAGLALAGLGFARRRKA